MRTAQTRQVPLLAIRLPDLERTAWRQGRAAAHHLERRAAAAFRESAARVLRGADILGHDEHSEVFLAALLDRAREHSAVPSPTDCRNALRRLSAALTAATGLKVESGWTIVGSFVDGAGLPGAVERALERGARERERYDFFSTVGHELRTPLTSIRGYLETLLAADLEPERARRFLEIAHTESLRLARLLEGMFEISLFDMRALRLGEGGDVAAAIDRAAEVLLPVAQERRVTIRTRVHPAAVLLDDDHLMQMLLNLVDNAVKHGKPHGTVVVSCEVEDERFVRICVDDDGPGVPEAERERIFALSARGSSAAGGSGIGLAFVRLMAERIGGDVAVAGSELGGARFLLRLPSLP